MTVKKMQKPEDLEAETQRTRLEACRDVARELLLPPSNSSPASLQLPLDTLPLTSSLEKSDFIIKKKKKSQSLKQVSILLQMESCPGAETCLLG